MSEFVWPVRVYYEDTDAGGVVYHASYLKFMERARTEWLRALGFEQDGLARQGVLFVVRSVALDYRRPARFNDNLRVESRVVQLRRAALTFEQNIVDDPSEAPVCSGRVTVVCVDAHTLRPKPMPQTIVAEIAGDR